MKVIVEKLPYPMLSWEGKRIFQDWIFLRISRVLSRAACDLSWNLRYDAYAGSILEEKKKKKDLEEGLTCRIILGVTEELNNNK